MGTSSPQQFDRALDVYHGNAAMDDTFCKIAADVERRLGLLEKLSRVRVKAWLSKLRQSTSNLVWKRNRNQYARLLLEQLRAGLLEAPFNVMHADGGLATLPTHLTYRYLSPQRRPLRAARSVSPRRSHVYSDSKYSGDRQQRRRSSHEDEDDRDVDTRQHGRRASTPPLRNQLRLCSVRPTSAHIRLPHSEGRGAGYHSPAARALEAELGSARASADQLAWRLEDAEERIRQQEHQLSHLRRHCKSSRDKMRVATKACLDGVIDRLDERRAAWSSPRRRSDPESHYDPYPGSRQRAEQLELSSSTDGGDAAVKPLVRLLGDMHRILSAPSNISEEASLQRLRHEGAVDSGRDDDRGRDRQHQQQQRWRQQRRDSQHESTSDYDRDRPTPQRRAQSRRSDGYRERHSDDEEEAAAAAAAAAVHRERTERSVLSAASQQQLGGEGSTVSQAERQMQRLLRDCDATAAELRAVLGDSGRDATSKAAAAAALGQRLAALQQQLSRLAAATPSRAPPAAANPPTATATAAGTPAEGPSRRRTAEDHQVVPAERSAMSNRSQRRPVASATGELPVGAHAAASHHTSRTHSVAVPSPNQQDAVALSAVTSSRSTQPAAAEPGAEDSSWQQQQQQQQPVQAQQDQPLLSSSESSAAADARLSQLESANVDELLAASESLMSRSARRQQQQQLGSSSAAQLGISGSGVSQLSMSQQPSTPTMTGGLATAAYQPAASVAMSRLTSGEPLSPRTSTLGLRGGQSPFAAGATQGREQPRVAGRVAVLTPSQQASAISSKTAAATLAVRTLSEGLARELSAGARLGSNPLLLPDRMLSTSTAAPSATTAAAGGTAAASRLASQAVSRRVSFDGPAAFASSASIGLQDRPGPSTANEALLPKQASRAGSGMLSMSTAPSTSMLPSYYGSAAPLAASTSTALLMSPRISALGGGGLGSGVGSTAAPKYAVSELLSSRSSPRLAGGMSSRSVADLGAGLGMSSAIAAVAGSPSSGAAALRASLRATGTPSSAGAARLQPSPSADDVGARLQAMALLRPSAAAGQLSSNFDTAASAAKRLLNPAAAAPVRSALGSGLSPRASITGVLSSPRASVAGGLGMGAGGIGSGGLSSPRASITGGLGLSAGSMGGLLSDRTGMAGAGSRAPLLAASSSLMGPSAWSPRSARASDTGGTAGGASDVAARLAAMRSKFTDFKSRSSTLSAAPSFAS